MALSKPEFPSQLFSERFDLKLFLSLDLIRELVALQHRQTTGYLNRKHLATMPWPPNSTLSLKHPDALPGLRLPLRAVIRTPFAPFCANARARGRQMQPPLWDLAGTAATRRSRPAPALASSGL